ncbi:HK97 family phage prohead protease [Aureimonas sp. AU12]|uniref:HK97 family phage prohead protease n=1 Tax=Aureimonas sp. AU12 TaxID=1638161 RepID=UPI0007867FAE|nr:HK97 family phage prohead protease [Aureimonas sp. AU12]
MTDHIDLSFRFAAPDESGIFTGLAAVHTEPNSHGETIRFGAFKRTLAEHKRAGTRPLMLRDHDPRAIVGVWETIVETDKGLAVTGRFIRETAGGAEAYALVKAGAVNGLSIGFRARADTRGPNGSRIITDIDLVEISLVGLPSAARARIKTIHSQHGRPSSAAAFIEACRKAARSLETRS